MNAEIIAVGSELLLGQITNTNARFISEKLASIGINVFYHTVVGDNAERLKKAIKIAESRADLIIFSGGLGPTKDDLTKESIAEVLGVKLVFEEEALHSIENYFKKRNRPMTENNKKQALILDGAEVLPNLNGMAPGMILDKDNKTYCLLPGPPSELEPMFTNFGINALLKRLTSTEIIQSRVLRFFGIGEAQLEHDLIDLIDQQTNPTIAPLAGNGEVTIRLTAKSSSLELAEELINETEKEILNRVGQYFYGYGDTTLIKEMGRWLEKSNLTLAAAESLTGGLFQEEVTSISGVSKWFKGGVVTYSADVKEKVLGVKKETIDQYGVVSEQCAREMAENVRELVGADIGVSFTGVAGPASLEGKEPGTVYVGIAMKGKETKVSLLQLFGNRETIRIRSIKNAAWRVIGLLNDVD